MNHVGFGEQVKTYSEFASRTPSDKLNNNGMGVVIQLAVDTSWMKSKTLSCATAAGSAGGGP
jgi:hypothetical protein